MKNVFDMQLKTEKWKKTSTAALVACALEQTLMSALIVSTQKGICWKGSGTKKWHFLIIH